MLTLIDMQLQQAFSENKNEPFGDRSIIIFGDFGQLSLIYFRYANFHESNPYHGSYQV